MAQSRMGHNYVEPTTVPKNAITTPARQKKTILGSIPIPGKNHLGKIYPSKDESSHTKVNIYKTQTSTSHAHTLLTPLTESDSEEEYDESFSLDSSNRQ